MDSGEVERYLTAQGSKPGGVYGNFDIVLHHPSRGSQLRCPTHAVRRALLGVCARWMVIGTCDPMLCPIRVFVAPRTPCDVRCLVSVLVGC